MALLICSPQFHDRAAGDDGPCARARIFRRVPSAAPASRSSSRLRRTSAFTSLDYAGVRVLDPHSAFRCACRPGTFWLFSEHCSTKRADRAGETGVFATLLATGLLRSTPAAGVGTVLYYASSLALVAVALARVIRGFPSDLVEPRRRLRAVLTAAVGLETLIRHRRRGPAGR